MSSPSKDLYRQRLRGWLRNMQLEDNPFDLHEAERELGESEKDGPPILSLFFLERPYLYEALGDPAKPQVTFLMAERGCGKTATRAMIAYECQYGSLRRRVLTVSYTDFEPLLKQVDRDSSRLTARHHIRAVLRSAIKSILEQVPPSQWTALPEFDRQVFMGFVRAFADEVTRIKIQAVIEEQGAELEWSALSPLELLQSFADLVTQMGREAVYILVDRVDEFSETAQDLTAAVSLLRPLISDQPLLGMKNVAFKFFLPVKVGTALRDAVSIRPDRWLWRTIVWDRDSLKELIQLRLRYYSNDYIPDMESLCVSEARYMVMDKLISASQESPRTLLRLCNRLIRQHVENSRDLLISRSDITQTLLDFEQQLELEGEMRRLKTGESTRTPPGDSLPSEGIYLDENDHVWVDGLELAEQPSPLEFRLLEKLYSRAGTIVSNEELMQAVWHSKYAQWEAEGAIKDYDETNLRKLVARLRKRLDTASAGRSRSIRNVRGRGYWLKAE